MNIQTLLHITIPSYRDYMRRQRKQGLVSLSLRMVIVVALFGAMRVFIRLPLDVGLFPGGVALTVPNKFPCNLVLLIRSGKRH